MATRRQSTNLHAVWDTGLIEQLQGGRSALREAVAAERVPAETDQGAAAAVEESCRVVGTPGFYPDKPAIDPDYHERWSRTAHRSSIHPRSRPHRGQYRAAKQLRT